MESLQQTIHNLASSFESRMAEFDKELRQNNNAPPGSSSPTSRLTADFEAFRTFVIFSLQALQTQVALLSKLHDAQEMRSRRKMLLVHGVPEVNKENPSITVVKVMCEKLNMPDIDVDSISQCHRLGKSNGDKPRPILVKFRDQQVRNSVWFAKTRLKNSGYTFSEFLIKERHQTFMAAREKFGVSKCWTWDGHIFILSPDGKRHRITSLAELNEIVLKKPAPAAVSAPVENSQKDKGLSEGTGSRPKRTNRAK